MIVLKVKLRQEPSGALYAEVLDGLNSVSQNNRAKNKLRVELDGFDLEDGVEFLQAGYSTSSNENDVETETVNFAIMSEVNGNAWEQEIPPEVVVLRGKWCLYLRVATFDGTGDVSSVNNATNEIEFTVNNALPAANNAYPNMGDIASLYAQSKENASAADSSAQASESSAHAAASSAESAQEAQEEAEAAAIRAAKVSPIVLDETLNVSTTHENIVVGYSSSIDLESLNKVPNVGDKAWAMCKTRDNYIYSVLLEFTAEPNNEGFVSFIFAEILNLHDGSLDSEVKRLEEDKLNKRGGFIEGDLTVQGNLTVEGTNFVEDAETYTVKENVIVTNSGGQEIGVHLSGLAIKKNQSKAYGIMYDPANDGVKVGLGEVDKDGEFTYDTDENDESEGQFLATRGNNMTDQHLPIWNAERNRFEDSGRTVGDLVSITTLSNYVYGTWLKTKSDGTKYLSHEPIPWGFAWYGNSLAMRNGSGVLQARMPDDVDAEVEAEGWKCSDAYVLVNARALAKLKAEKGKANGVASLDSNGQIPWEQIPESKKLYHHRLGLYFSGSISGSIYIDYIDTNNTVETLDAAKEAFNRYINGGAFVPAFGRLVDSNQNYCYVQSIANATSSKLYIIYLGTNSSGAQATLEGTLSWANATEFYCTDTQISADIN